MQSCYFFSKLETHYGKHGESVDRHGLIRASWEGEGMLAVSSYQPPKDPG